MRLSLYLAALIAALPACAPAASPAPSPAAAAAPPAASEAPAAPVASASITPPAEPPAPAPTATPEAPAAKSEPPASPPLTAILRQKHGVFADRAEVAVHAPGSLRHLPETPVVVFLHGWNNCLRVLLGSENAPCRPGKAKRFGMDLLAQFDAAQVNALLVVPQLAFDEASSAPGESRLSGRLKLSLDEVLSAPQLAPYLPDERRLGRVVLIAHSGSYEILGKLLGRGGADVHEVWMMDAHYINVPELKPWFVKHQAEFWPGRRRRMAFIYTEGEHTGPRSQSLLLSLAGRLPAEHRDEALWMSESEGAASDEQLARPLVAQKTTVAHENIPRRWLAPLLRTSGLPAR